MAADTANSRSPSPAAAPPVAATPGPRATALQKLYGDAIAHVLKTCNYANFSACFPTPAKEIPGQLKNVHEQFTDRLGETMRREFENILEDRHVVGSLNELDGLIEDARRRKARSIEEGGAVPVPPHTLPAQQLYLSHLAPSLSQHSQTLQEQQHTLQDENVELLSRVMQQRKEIENMIKGLENVISDVDASVAALQSPDADVDGLRDGNRDADEDMRMIT